MDQDLAQINKNTLQIVPISNNLDLIKVKPIVLHLNQDNGATLVLKEIRVSLEKCAIGLGIKMSDYQVKILCQDILEIYKYDSVEDIQQCFKKARQGEYSFEHFKRDVISMPLFRLWMTQHLTDKVNARERAVKEKKIAEENELSSNEMTEEAREKAQKYIDQIKGIIDDSKRKKQLKDGAHTYTTPEFWMNEIQKDRGRRLLYRLIMKKIDKGEELTFREAEWCKAWNIKIR